MPGRAIAPREWGGRDRPRQGKGHGQQEMRRSPMHPLNPCKQDPPSRKTGGKGMEQPAPPAHYALHTPGEKTDGGEGPVPGHPPARLAGPTEAAPAGGQRAAGRWLQQRSGASGPGHAGSRGCAKCRWGPEGRTNTVQGSEGGAGYGTRDRTGGRQTDTFVRSSQGGRGDRRAAMTRTGSLA